MSDAGVEQFEPLVLPATGFWRLARPEAARRTWLVGPEGRASFLLGVNTVMRDTQRTGRSRCEGIGAYIGRSAPSEAAHVEWARLSSGESGAFMNTRPYGFNSVGAFSETNDFDDSGGDSYMVRAPEVGGAGAPYAVVVSVAPKGDDRALKDEAGNVLLSGFSGAPVGDPFNPDFLDDLDARIATEVVARRGDPRLQMWFAGNEIGVFDVAGHGSAGVRDFRRWLWSDVPAGSSIDRPLCARHALAAFLRECYTGSIADLNAAWGAAYPDFGAIVDTGPRPVPYVHDANARCRADLQRFVHDVFLREWVRAVTLRLRAADPNHLIASPRLAVATPRVYRFWSGRSQPEPDRWAEPPGATVGTGTVAVHYSPFDLLGRDGEAGFDLVAINAYTGASRFPEPWFSDGLNKIHDQSGLPLVISEFGVRARIDGWSNRGGAGAFVPHGDTINDQLQRGRRYRSQIDQFISLPDVVGAVWHAWSDRFMPTDPSLQINLGLVQCADPAHRMRAGQRWTPTDELIAETNHTVLQRIVAKTGI
jgi:hypothetical protein